MPFTKSFIPSVRAESILGNAEPEGRGGKAHPLHRVDTFRARDLAAANRYDTRSDFKLFAIKRRLAASGRDVN